MAKSTVMSPEIRTLLQRLPSVDKAIRELLPQYEEHPRWALTQAVREHITELRQQVLAGQIVDPRLDPNDITQRLNQLLQPSLRPVINATGVVLHTNLGRAPLSATAIQRITEIAAGYSNLEYQLGYRSRGSRYSHIVNLICQIVGAEDALVVNNNAAALLLVLTALAHDREVIVSRGELVEIGGSFRLPEVMTASGVTLREVGTTNRTHLRDYEKAINSQTALLLKVHHSNFAIVGFTAEVEPEELVALGRTSNIPTLFDLGSGNLIDLTQLGLPREPTIAKAIQGGFDLVCFSGDKVLGGPQAGILVGRSPLITRLRSHPLMRALRPDKMTLAGLGATLEAYRDGSEIADLPVLSMLATPESVLRKRALRLRNLLRRTTSGDWSFSLLKITSQVGGGSLPQAMLPSWGVTVNHPQSGPDAIEEKLRNAATPILARIEKNHLILDVRTIFDAQIAHCSRVLATALQR